METLGERMREAVKGAGLTTVSVAKALDVSESALRHYFNGRNEPSINNMIRFADFVNVSLIDLINPPSMSFAETSKLEPTSKEFVPIPVRNIELSAGSGAAPNTEEVIGHLAFRADWLRANQISPNEASLVRVFGKSMEPTLIDGDMVLVDHRKTNPMGKEVYAMRQDDGTLIIKRLEVVPLKFDLLVHSDNPDFGTSFIPKEKRDLNPIIGKVVWSARTWKGK